MRALSRRTSVAEIPHHSRIHVRAVYDDKHRFYQVSPIATKPDRLLQKGLRARLLCGECEHRLSVYENYARHVFFGNEARRPHRTRTGFLFTELKYKPLKLFFMTLL